MLTIQTRTIEVSGTHYEIGYQLGKMIETNLLLKSIVENHEKFIEQRRAPDAARFANAILFSKCPVEYPRKNPASVLVPPEWSFARLSDTRDIDAGIRPRAFLARPFAIRPGVESSLQ